jgi:hypothetical protein
MLQDKIKAQELLQLIIRHGKGQISALEKLLEELKKEGGYASSSKS